MNHLEAQIQKVRLYRIALERIKSEMDAKVAAFNEANKDLILKQDEAKNDLVISEDALRELTLIAYQETGNKKPAIGVGIRMVKQVEYDEAEALNWAVEAGAANCLSLQKTNFKKVAEGLRLDFVTICEVAQATISREL